MERELGPGSIGRDAALHFVVDQCGSQGASSSVAVKIDDPRRSAAESRTEFGGRLLAFRLLLAYNDASNRAGLSLHRGAAKMVVDITAHYSPSGFRREKLRWRELASTSGYVV